MRALKRPLLAVVALLALAGAAPAQPYPTKPVTIVVPYTPGGTTDLLARLSAQVLQEELGGSFVIENRPGAGASLGTAVVAKAAPDGHTLLLGGATALTVNPFVYKNVTYDPVRDFAPIALLSTSAFVLAVNSSLGVNSVRDLVALAREKPGALTFASAGPGTPQHLYAELFKSMTGTRIEHVPYRGSVPAATDVAAGRVSMIFVDLAPALPFIQSGQLRVLGVTTARRIKALPDIPTLAEAGVPGYEAGGWQSLVAPAGTPKPVIERVNTVIARFLQRPETAEKFQSFGMEAQPGSPAALAELIRANVEKWGKVIPALGLKVE